jgi:hypothetical protein
MNNRHLAAVVSIAFTAFTTLALLAQPDDKTALAAKPLVVTTLPIKNVVLTNSGLGYFKREGVIDGPTRVELKVIEEDVNDLILTLLVNDPKGKSPTILLENRAPADLTLKAFKIDVTENPTVGQLLSQVRGEEVKVVYGENKSITGRVVSVTTRKETKEVDRNDELNPKSVVTSTSSDSEMLTLLTADGLTAIPVAKLTSTKFLNAEVQAEFTKVLLAVAAALGEAKKTVTIDLPGVGKRPVSLSYIADAPIWKPTYRLVLEGDKAKLIAQAAIENISEDDWDQVRLKLVNSRPVTYKMNLYDPLFVPREYVEPRMYASLRPPMYQASQMGSGVGQMGQLGQLGGGNLGVGGGAFGFGGGAGAIGFVSGAGLNASSMSNNKIERATTRQLLYGQRSDGTTPEGDPNAEAPPRRDVQSVDKARGLGSPVEYTIADPLTLPRFKSAIVTLFTDTIETQPISIYNATILEKHPMQGMRLVNKSKQVITEGPVAVYQNDQLVGQATLPDLTANESRLLSFGVDLDVQVLRDGGTNSVSTDPIKIHTGQISRQITTKDTISYTVINSSKQAKNVWISVPIREKWTLLNTVKPIEQSASFYRFEVKVAANSTEKFSVVEQNVQIELKDYTKLSDSELLENIIAKTTTAKVREALQTYRNLRMALIEVEYQVKLDTQAIEEITKEQTRLRANIEKVPMTSDVYKRYLKKFDDQETEVETRQAKIKEFNLKKTKLKAELEEMLKSLSAE